MGFVSFGSALPVKAKYARKSSSTTRFFSRTAPASYGRRSSALCRSSTENVVKSPRAAASFSMLGADE